MTLTAMTPTATRHTQTLTVPPTQNTAPVLEYQCLYTHDLRRKQKRWQDGFLCFHTFNKRIMVYEMPSKNYIGDQHWRQEEVLQEGDELQLERPVLVQVGEAIGSKETDLTELLEKRKKPHEPISKAKPHAPVPSHLSTLADPVSPRQAVVAQPSQLRPKSLNAVLGTPKGRTGRAAISAMSPYQLRRENENIDPVDGRPPKRQRLSSDVDLRTATMTRSKDQPPATSKESNATISGSSRSSVVEIIETDEGTLQTGVGSTKRHPKHSAKTSLMEEQPESMPTRGKPPAINKTHAEARTKRNDEGQMSDGSRISDVALVSDRTTNQTKRHTTNTAILRPQYNDTAEADSSDTATSARSKLQVAARKPRKKLMYRDLLPDRPPTKQNLTSYQRQQKRGSVNGGHSMPVDSHRNEGTALANRPNYRIEESARTGDNDHESITTTTALTPDSFISQDDYPSAPISHHQTEGPPVNSNNSSLPRAGFCDRSKIPHTQACTEGTSAMSAPGQNDTSLNLSRLDEIMFPTARHTPPKVPESIVSQAPVRNNERLSRSPLQASRLRKANSDATPTKTIPDSLANSSPAFQKQTHVSPEALPQEALSCASSLNETSLWKNLHLDSEPDSRQQSSAISSNIQPAEIPPPEDQPQPVSHTPQSEKHLQPTPSPHPFLHSNLSKSPSSTFTSTSIFTHHPPHPPSDTLTDSLIIAQKPLPAFQAPRPKPRSPLKKSTSDTSSMRRPPPTSLLHPTSHSGKVVMERGREAGGNGGNDEDDGNGEKGATPWSKEAWDLFGCGRDGVECSYEEFRRKEGLV